MFKKTILIIALLMLGLVGMTAAQDADLPPIAGVIDEQAVIIHDGEIVTFDGIVAFNAGFAWSPDGATVAFFQSTAPDTRWSPENTLVVGTLDGTLTPIYTSEQFTTSFPLSWTTDGRILFAESTEEPVESEIPEMAGMEFYVNVYAIAPTADATPQIIGQFPYGVGCGGGADQPAFIKYWEETDLGGSRSPLQVTADGLLFHASACAGNDMALTDLNSGVTQKLGEEPVTRAALSPDESRVAAMRTTYNELGAIRTLVVINLADLTETVIETDLNPDQVTWQDDNTLIYSAAVPAGNLLENAEDAAAFEANYGYNPGEITAYDVAIHAVDLTTGEETVLFSGEGWAAGRLQVVADQLIFSLVDNMDEWVSMIVSGEVDQSVDSYESSLDLVSTRVLRVPLDGSGTVTEIQPDMAQFVAAPQ